MTTGARRLRTSAPPEEQEATILACARREFAEVGVRRASMDAVARAAGVSRSTLYRRFPNKDALLAKVGEVIGFETIRHLAGAVRGLSARDAVVEAFVEYTRIFDEDPLVRRLLVEEPDVAEVLVSQTSRTAGDFLESSSAAVASTLRRAGATMSDDDLALAAEHFVRIAFSLAQIRTRRLDLGDVQAIRDYATRFLAPMVS
ncbi:TetR/AcrR family transcriptional regulator [Gordonia neofelifaecis]|uniref:Transcriptional regulator, TetR family protein n=1 Tax=Gordonia neofelifaecis NRRL B-59395 TaxID=644548 RepID=F1YK01_9ACTN|nr:TetR/AcrR family transcriptional regulator [Gordonia neofelifaecis]EGD55083.1 transcriptional regulator, TetR family protein [Gordonia neofelifaecis NRRL B-59395]